MFGSKFFHTYNISLLSYEDFDNFDYKLKCDYVEYIYNNINKILEKIIDTIKLYDKKDILKNLNITSNQLIDIAFLTGTDYNYGLYKSSMDSNFELIMCRSFDRNLNHSPPIESRCWFWIDTE